MHRIRVDPTHPERHLIERAAAIIRRGGLVAFPTETVYGLGADGLDETAVRRVFDAKGRPAFNPLILHVADLEAARSVVHRWPDVATALATAFWPGPLTLVLPRAEHVPAVVTGGLPHVAVRVPAHPVALALLAAAGRPIVAPSANPSSAVSPTTAEHVDRAMGDRVDLILDAGETRLGIESTVIDLSADRPALLRPGALDAAEIETVTGPLARPDDGDRVTRRASPGMLARHYAPRARVHLFDGKDRRRTEEEVRARIADPQEYRIGGLLLAPFGAPLHYPVQMPPDAAAYGRRLYAELHRLDTLGCDFIVIEHVPAGTAWDAVRDRLARAAARAGRAPGA